MEGVISSYFFDRVIIRIRILFSFLKSCIRLILNKHLPYVFREKLAVIKQYVQAHKHTSKHRAIVDISQTCNAKCYYCPSGFSNRERGHREKRGATFIDIGLFERILIHLKKQGFIGKYADLDLYNKGEPFLHPNFEEIINITTCHGIFVNLSTNASVLPKVSEKFNAAYIHSITFSMPGFSQASYDKIHGFRFELIKNNIAWIVKFFRQHGFIGQFGIAYHVYQFNLHELQSAYRFATSLGIFFSPVFARCIDWKRLRQYMQGKLPYNQLLDLTKDLIVNSSDLFYGKQIKDVSQCDISHYVTVNTDGTVDTCCMTKDFPIGNVFEMTRDKLDQLHKNSDVCATCIKSGIIRGKNSKTLLPHQFGILRDLFAKF